MFILVRGELHVLDSDQSTCMFKVSEGTVFGEATVLRHMEVRLARAQGGLGVKAIRCIHAPSDPLTWALAQPIPCHPLPEQGATRAKRVDNVWCATPCTMLRIAQVRGRTYVGGCCSPFSVE